MSVAPPGAARNGMHKFDNQDRSMLTAMMAVANMEGAEHNIWSANTDFECHEEQRVDAPRPEAATPHHVAPRGTAALG